MDNQQLSINNLFYQRPAKGKGYIYKYTSPSGKSYVGQTINSLAERAKSLSSGKGYKKCSVFWKAIQKYGWSNFSSTILEEIEVEKLNEREQYYIKLFNTLAPNGYNLTNGGDGGKKKDVFVYSAQNGNLLEHYSSLSEAAEHTGVPINIISSIIHQSGTKIRRQSHNLTFLDYYISKFDITNLSRNSYHKVYVYDKEGNYLQSYETIASAAKDLQIGVASINKNLSGAVTHASYYQFRNEKYDKINPVPKNSKTPVSVCQIDPITNKIIAVYPSYAAAGRAVGLSNGNNIKRVIERGKGLSGGYKWKINESSTTKHLENPTKSARDPRMGEDIV